MAGSYQHYLQQMLQRGFRRPDGSKKRPSVWVYTKESPPFSKRIESFGGEHEFYSNVSTGLTKTLDDKITEWEAHRQADVRKWRTLPNGTRVESNKAAELVGLTGVRTKATRQAFQTLFGEMLPKFGQAFQDPDFVLNHIENNEDVSGQIIDLMTQQLANTQNNPEEVTSSLEFKAMTRLLTYVISEVSSHALSKSLRDLDLAFQEMLDSGKFDLVDAHKSALEKSLDEAAVRDDLLKLNWWIARNKYALPWILPDCAILELDENNNYTQFMLRTENDRQAVILPLSHDAALIGSVAEEQNVELSKFTDAAAACSVEFYVANQKLPELESTQKTIGTQLSDGVVSMMGSVLDDLYSMASSKEFASIPALKNVSFHTHDLQLSEEELCDLANQIAPFLWSLGESFDLSLIQRIVITSSVSKAYAERRPKEELNLSQDDCRHLVWWIENGETSLEYTLLMHISAVQVLCDPDHESFEYVYKLFAQNLAQIHVRAVACQQSDFDALVSLYVDEDVGWRIRDIALRASCAFMETLYGCRIEDASIDHLPQFQARLINALDQFESVELPNTSDVTQNNERVWGIAHAVEEVMYNTARYAAACEHLIVSVTDAEQNKCVRDKLEEHHLIEWMHRLDLDFQRLRVNFSHPLDPERMIAIQRHTERVLWGRSMIIVGHESGGYIRPFIDEGIHYESIRCELEKYFSQVIPADLSSLIVR